MEIIFSYVLQCQKTYFFFQIPGIIDFLNIFLLMFIVQAMKSLSTHVTVEGLPKAVISTFLKASPGILKELSTNEINLNSVDFKLVEALMPFQRQGVRYGIFGLFVFLYPA